MKLLDKIAETYGKKQFFYTDKNRSNKVALLDYSRVPELRHTLLLQCSIDIPVTPERETEKAYLFKLVLRTPRTGAEKSFSFWAPKSIGVYKDGKLLFSKRNDWNDFGGSFLGQKIGEYIDGLNKFATNTNYEFLELDHTYFTIKDIEFQDMYLVEDAVNGNRFKTESEVIKSDYHPVYKEKCLSKVIGKTITKISFE